MSRKAKKQSAAVAVLFVFLAGQGCRFLPWSAPDYVEEGIACWYGDPYHGRRTASGERFNKGKLTAAHRTLPFGTIAVVRNLRNGKTVKVRINDRGPFIGGRIIDLSQKAARKLGMIDEGLVPCRIEVVNWGTQ